MTPLRKEIFDLVNSISPHDEIEKSHIQSITQWIASDSEIFRISKPDNPRKHLVSYFTLLDVEEDKILLVNHRKAGLWLPAGGHVELEEHPATTVTREIEEELGITETNFLFTSHLTG